MSETEAEAVEAVERHAAGQAAERRKRRESEAPWKRTAPGEITFRDKYWWHNPSFLGPFGPGDRVSVNGEATGVIEYVTDTGFLVMPEMAPGAHHLGYWIVGANVRTIRPSGWIDRGVLKPVDDVVVEDSTLGDPSLPMSPPPQPPGGESTFR